MDTWTQTINTNTQYMSKQTEKNTTCTDRDTKKNVYYILNNFDYLHLHFCGQKH